MAGSVCRGGEWLRGVCVQAVLIEREYCAVRGNLRFWSWTLTALGVLPIHFVFLEQGVVRLAKQRRTMGYL